MMEPTYGYIETDINHWLSIPLVILMPLAVLFGLCYFFNKKRKAVKENKQSKWHLAPFIIVISLWSFFIIFEGVLYGMAWLHPNPVCRHFWPDIVREGGNGGESTLLYLDLIYNVEPSKIDFYEWPVCPEDKDALEAYIRDNPD